MEKTGYRCAGKGCEHRDCRWRDRQEGKEVFFSEYTKYIPKNNDSPGWIRVVDCQYFSEKDEGRE